MKREDKGTVQLSGHPPEGPEPSMAPAQPISGLERNYALALVIGGAASARPFRISLAGVAVGAKDAVYALGDNEVRIFAPDGSYVRSWKAPAGAACLTVDPNQRVYLGVAGRVEIYDAGGNRTGGFNAGQAGRPAAVTAVKVARDAILVADAASRVIRRFDASGKFLGLIGDRSKAGSFILPNKSLDLDVDAAGVIRATDTGRHQVTTWNVDGSPVSSFGKFGMSNPADFAGCCNPVNLAVTPDGKIVTGEKMVARVKVYEPDGRLLAMIGPGQFDPGCTHIYLAVDSQGRILAGDPVRREVRVFSQLGKAAVRKTEEAENL